MENKTFEDASAAAEQLFVDAPATALQTAESAEEPEVVTESETDNAVADSESVSEAAPAPAVTPEEAALENAANVAEAAAQAAEQANTVNEQLKAELEAARAQIEELSKQNEKHVVEEALKPPVLDMNALTFATEEEQAAIMEDYNARLAEFNRANIMRDLAPDLEFAKEGRLAQERNETISALSNYDRFSDIGNYAQQIERIIKNNAALASDNMSMEEKVVNAYLIAKGANSINNPPAAPKEPSTDELMALYQNNPAFREAIEKQRLAEIKNSQQVPPFSASSGAVNAALNIEEEPQTLEEASLRARKMFGAE